MKLLSELRTVVLELRLLFFKSEQELVIVTGSDSSHFKSLYQLLVSLNRYEKNTKVLIYDLGITAQESEILKNDFSNFELRKFDYSKYPSYFNIKINAGEYAWKPVIINDVLNEFKTSVCWLDGGNKVTKPLTLLRKVIEFYGFYSPFSKGKISDWTHPKSLEYLDVLNNKNLLKQKNLNGACVSVDYNNIKARQVIKNWSDSAKTKDCIAPQGSNRQNHRQDQAILSVLIYKHMFDIGKKMTYRKFGFKTHQDID
ncbi:hypothetical protein BW723_10980 [Polaribacter reichenbachii]|uniref:Uncharacterized protein n=1 Tax=Polaribacter reichenbachii TaxID=996801 RepID=A0A1B8TQG7_9FLAO|nr:DUF1647 domain-containing protein [Polaribacter reichenbachii]APZ46774.1 hypothetical protein BW723_10980 [Polaribacter reichenbachii]AUC17417.1 hypothetical protein BTO17_01425 [Polaribacter reichenbachii]OBY61708.1 hypothetical protein LPB301_16780 [Polaribacter reichenbachii]